MDAFSCGEPASEDIGGMSARGHRAAGLYRSVADLKVCSSRGKTQLHGGGRRGGSRAPTPLVGRTEQLEILTRRWERARCSEGQLALIVGEPAWGNRG
jgi:hypothetical protein